jgi:hypothetical protein
MVWASAPVCKAAIATIGATLPMCPVCFARFQAIGALGSVYGNLKPASACLLMKAVGASPNISQTRRLQAGNPTIIEVMTRLRAGDFI